MGLASNPIDPLAPPQLIGSRMEGLGMGSCLSLKGEALATKAALAR